MNINTVLNCDCLGEGGMPLIPDKSIDMILCDLPYGTTVIACINTNRNYILMEKEEKYYDIINERIKQHTQLTVNTTNNFF